MQTALIRVNDKQSLEVVVIINLWRKEERRMLSKGCKVSIITVVYNGAKTIEQTILSVMNQTYKNIEYIIIDGQSTDGTQKIIERYRQYIAYYVSEKDAGLYDAMNKGIRQAKGELIGIINSDDWYENNAVEKAVEYLTIHEAGLVHGRIMVFDLDGNQRLEPLVPLETIWYQTAVQHPTVFVKKSIYEKFGCFNLKYQIAADYELFLRLYCEHVDFGFIDEVLTNFREGGISNKKQEQGYWEALDASKKYIKKYSDKKEEMFHELENAMKAKWFNLRITSNKSLLFQLLCAYFQEDLSEIMIFGAGRKGITCYEALKNESLKIKLFIDNDLKKKNQMFYNIKIVTPQELPDKGEIFILIAIKDAEKEIKEQLNGLTNSNLKYVGLDELGEFYFKNLFLAIKNTAR